MISRFLAIIICGEFGKFYVIIYLFLFYSKSSFSTKVHFFVFLYINVILQKSHLILRYVNFVTMFKKMNKCCYEYWRDITSLSHWRVAHCRVLLIYATPDEADAYMFYRCFFCFFLFFSVRHKNTRQPFSGNWSSAWSKSWLAACSRPLSMRWQVNEKELPGSVAV